MDFVTLHARLRPNKLAVNDLAFNTKWSYAEFDIAIAKVVTLLTQQGIATGDRVGCLAKNRAEIVALHLACARLGAIIVPLNWRLNAEELVNIIDDCQPAILFADEQGELLDIAHQPISEIFSSSSALPPAPAAVIDDAIASLILYTSGTTGKPKGVMLSEKNIAATAINFSLLATVDSHSVFLCEAPMFHVIGLVTSVRTPLYQGGTILISDAFIPSRTLARLTDVAYGVTHYFCVPQMANVLRNEESFNPEGLRGLTALLTGGAPHPEVQIRSWLNDGIPIVDGYGMSEAGTILGMPLDIDLLDKKAGSVGLAPHNMQIRLANSNEQEVALGESGEVQIKGDNICIGYWLRESEFSDCFTADGWFCTGDIAVKDEDDYYRIVDRKKDMFISGGENVYPTEVEGIVLKHFAIAECAMIGIPDERWGEVGCLFVVLKPKANLDDSQVLIDFLDGYLARYKLPKHVVIKDTLPRNGAGKVMKHVLKADYLAK